MISDEELLALPDDSELGLFALHQKLKNEVEKLRELSINDENVFVQGPQYEHASHVYAYIEANGLRLELPVVLPPNNSEHQRTYEQFVRILDRIALDRRYRDLRQIQEGSISSVELTPDTKVEIHNHLAEIREIIERSGLTDRKKNAILAKLNKLVAEVDRVATRTDMFFGLYLDGMLILGQGAEHAKPFWDQVKSIIKVITKEKARNEGVALPSVEEVPLLGDKLGSEPNLIH